jgi:hypothetical protein
MKAKRIKKKEKKIEKAHEKKIHISKKYRRQDF